ncbi:MAG: AraC family transcriptional regulator [Bacteroidetes bacterium]|nr:MAG: AraC family transcriptional regulator [Bacteroidota bacterium]
MKVVQFTIPVAKENSVIVQEDHLPHFYNHLHRHKETQITWIIRGEGTLIAGNYMQRFKSGEIYIIGANQPHIFKSDVAYFDKRKKKSIHSLTIFFDPKGFFSPLLELPEMKTVRRFVDSTTYGLQIPQDHQKNFTQDMLMVSSEKNGMRLSAFFKLLHHMSLLKNFKVLSSVAPEFSYSDSEGLRMNDIYQYTMKHYTENLSLQDIASISHLTPQAFCRYFKKHTRKTFVTFLNEVRISEACKKIVAGDFNSIAGVAYQTGFSNAVTFNRVFRKVMGKSPREYIREYIQKIE